MQIFRNAVQYLGCLVSHDRANEYKLHRGVKGFYSHWFNFPVCIIRLKSINTIKNTVQRKCRPITMDRGGWPGRAGPVATTLFGIEGP